jgi:hypothetical protein
MFDEIEFDDVGTFEAVADAKPRISAPLSVLGSLQIKNHLACLQVLSLKLD